MKHTLLQLMIVIIILMMLLPGCNVEKGPFLFGQEEAKDPEFSDVRDLFGFSSRWTSDTDAMDTRNYNRIKG